MTRLRVLRGGTPRPNRELGGWSSTLRPFEADVVGRSWDGKGMGLFVMLLPPGLNRELPLLCWDLWERLVFEE